MKCPACGGGGVVPEHHGSGFTEWLSCQECMGTGRVPLVCGMAAGCQREVVGRVHLPRWWGVDSWLCCQYHAVEAPLGFQPFPWWAAGVALRQPLPMGRL